MKLDAHDPWTYVRGVQPVSFCDWPGKISCVFFMGTCNLRCPFCHNATLAWYPENLPPVSKEEVYSLLQARKKWLEGIVISGGEPTQVPELSLFLSELRTFELPLKLDTNGFRPELLENLFSSGLVDMAAVDIKGPWRKYPELTGKRCTQHEAGKKLGRIIKFAEKQPDSIYFRCTLVPGITYADVEEVKSYLPPNFELKTQDYMPAGKVSQSDQVESSY